MPTLRQKKFARLLIALLLLGAFFYVGRYKLAAMRYNSGCVFYDGARYDEAVDSFKKSLAINPSVAAVYDMLARTYKAKRMPEMALSAYKKELGLDPHNLEAYRAVSEIYLEKGEYDEVRVMLKKAQEASLSMEAAAKMVKAVSFEAAADCLGKGADVFSGGDKDKAYALVREALIFKPDFLYARFMLAFFDYSLHKDDESEKRLKEIISQNPDFMPAHKLLGEIYFRRGDYKDAIKTDQEGLKIQDKDVSLNNDLGLAFNRTGRYDKAAHHFETALSSNPANLDIRYSLASNYRDEESSELAIAEYKKILSAKPNYPHIYSDLGGIYRRQGKSEESRRAYQKEIDFDRQRVISNPGDVVALNDLAYALNSVGEYAQAKQWIDRALTLAPGYGQAYLTLADIHENLKNFKEAEEALKKAEAFFKDAAFIKEAISRIRQEAKSFQNNGASGNTGNLSSQVVVYLKNGRKIKGQIKKEDARIVELEVSVNGTNGVVSLDRDAIDKIEAS